MRLTEKQNRFVDAYLLEQNGTKAAIAAGYSEKSAAVEASRLLRNAKVVAAIEVQRAPAPEVAAETSLDQRVIAELAKIAFADIREVVSWQANVVGFVQDEDGGQRLAVTNEVALKSSHELADAVAAGIAEISQTSKGALKVKMHSKLAALTKLGEHLGLFRPLGAGETKTPGKKAAAQEAAQSAGEGTDWGNDLHTVN
jgi:phage terminase small subunit